MKWSVSEALRRHPQEQRATGALAGMCPRPRRSRIELTQSPFFRVSDSAVGSVSSQMEAARHAQLRRRAESRWPAGVSGKDERSAL